MRDRSRRRRLLSASLAIVLTLSPAGPGRHASGAAPSPNDPDRDALVFPRAWGAHPSAALEWWYVTAILRDDAGLARGIQWTFFRVRLDADRLPAEEPGARTAGPRSAWRAKDLYLAHVAMGDSATHEFQVAERIGRTGPALAGADSSDLNVWIGDWSLRRGPDGRFRLRGGSDDGKTFDLDLSPSRQRPIAWGPAYRSAKSPDARFYSRYQSDPALAVTGTLHVPGRTPAALRGTAWFDHEWSDGRSDSAVVGWDWLGARLADGRAVMLYRLRDAAANAHHFFGGIVERDGRVTRVDKAELIPVRVWSSSRTSTRYPVAWRVLLHPEDAPRVTLDFRAVFDGQELVTPRSTRVTYWEGMVRGTAEQGGASTPLEGYLEMTGYAGGGMPGRISSGARTGR